MNNFQVVDNKGTQITTDETLHPGEVLEMEIEARNYKKTAFAALLQMRPSQLSELLHGKRHVSVALALKLEALLGINAEYWMRVQVSYDLEMERRKGGLLKSSAAG